MVKYILFIVVFFPFVSSGQADFFEIIFDSESQQDMLDNIDKIEEKVYKMQLNLESSADTFLINENGQQNYTLEEHNYLTCGPNQQVIIDGYNNEGNLIFKTFKKYDSGGRIIVDQTEYMEGYMLPMSYKKDYTFDEHGRLNRVTNTICDTCSNADEMTITYNENAEITQVNIRKSDIGVVSHVGMQIGDTMRYTADYSLTESYLNELKKYGNSEKDIPTEYVDVFKNEDGHTIYKGIRIDASTNNKVLKWKKIRNEENLVVEEEHYKNNKKVAHRKFTHDDFGNILTFEDVLKGKSYQNEFTKYNKYALKDLGSKVIHYDYDDKGNWTFMKVIPKGAVYIEKFIERTIHYLE